MKPIKSLDIICNSEFKLFGVVNGSIAIGYRFMKYLLLFLIISNYYVVNAQFDENNFKKTLIEIDGEEVFNVNIITQDHQGYIWMSTNLGLIRYDGIEGKRYEFSNDYSISTINYYVQALLVDHLGDIWVGAPHGLSKYNPDCDCLLQYPSDVDDINLRDIMSITEDNNKNIWIGTQNGGLYRYERGHDRFTRFLSTSSDPITIVNNSIHHLLVDRNNNLWIGTNYNKSKNELGLIRYNLTTGNVKQFLHDPSDPNSLLDNRISALYEDQQGQILIGTYKSGFHIYDTKSETLNRISNDANNPGQIHAPYAEDKIYGKDPDVQIIHQDQNGGYWIGTRGKGINYFNARTKTYKNYDFNLVNPQVLSSFYEDRQGNIWIGGKLGSGLFRTDLFARKHHLNTNFLNVEGAYESPLNPGILWVESMQQGLARMNLETNKITRYEHSINNDKSIGHNWVRAAYQENKRILWVGLGTGGAYGSQDGNGGIGRMDIEAETFTHYKLTRNDDELDDFSYSVYSICEDKEGNLWLGTGPGGIFRSDKEKNHFKHFNILNDDNLSGDVFLNIARIDKNGDVWASDFAGEGIIYLYDRKENKFSPYLKGFKMYNLLIDDKGWLLISTYEKGLVHLNPVDRTYIQYTKKDGLPSNDGLDIVKGENSIFWVNTRLGPAKFDSETGKISTVGLPKKRYNTTIFMASDNQIYVGSDNGLFSFYPDQVLGNPYPPQINISDLLISDKNYLAGKNDSNEISLSYNLNDITFKYIGLHFSNTDKNSYKYKLEPLDDNWINAGFERTARYANLPPGSYNFQVKAANSDGVWSEKAEFVQFTIKPSWWTTWWAYAIYIALVIFFADRFYRFQLSKRLAVTESERLKEVNQLKNSLYTNITHEFRTPLTVILGMADSLKSTLLEKQFKGAEHSLELIKRNGNNLLRLVNEMLDLSKLESGNMELQLVQADVIPFVKYLGESFHSMAQEKEISLTVYSEIDELLMDFDANKLSVVISNVLTNAVKFTRPGGKIIVHLNQISDNKSASRTGRHKFFFIKIKDNGQGISEKEIDNIFNRFYQVDNSSSRRGEGTGIGLALCKEFVELMNGTIKVKSSLGEGSEFIVQLPISNNATLTKDVQIHLEPDLSAPVMEEEFTEQISDDKSELPLALIIEDNADVAHYLKTCLTGKYQTIHAANGEIGIETAFEKIPDIIISDVMMPVKDGFEVCSTLKSDVRTDHIPIIMLTAKVAMKDKLIGLSHGADAYLTKPFVKAELLTRLDQLVLLRKKIMQKIDNDSLSNLLKKRAEDPETKFLQKTIKIIHEEISNHSFGSSVHLAHKMHLSESQIYRKLKAITGKSTAVFIRSVRLQKAKEMIQISDKTISEIAYEVGFNDPSWFSRAFKEEFGFAPSAISKP